MMVKLGDVCEKRIDTLKLSDEEYINYVDISSIDNNCKKIISVQNMQVKNAPSRAKQLIFKGDILVSTVRPNLNAVAMVEEDYNNILVASTGYCVLRCLDTVDNKYIFYFCQSKNFIDKMISQATGASYPAVSSNIIKNCKIPLPPLEEQRKIAETLDKVSDLINKRKQQLGKLDLLVKSKFVEMFGDCNNICKVSDVCKIITDGTHQPPQFVEHGIPFLFVSNVVTNKITYDTQKFISQETYDELIKRTPIEKNDILLSTVGSYGHAAIVEDDRKFLFQRHIAYLKPDNNIICSNYFHSALLSYDVQCQIDKSVKGIAQKTLNLSEIRKLKIPLPPIELQNQFADFVQQTEKTKTIINQSLEKLETLKKALMQEYFR